MIIGAGHRARAGKDEVAQYLVRQYGFRQTAFAKSLKAACREIFHLDDRYWNGEFKEQVHPFWGTTPRDILQQVGTEAMRQNFDRDIWIRSVQWEIEKDPGNYVISDVRFDNEARAIKQWGGFVWRIDRPNLPPISTTGHASETSLLGYEGWDDVIVNDGTLEDLYRKVDIAMEKIR